MESSQKPASRVYTVTVHAQSFRWTGLRQYKYEVQASSSYEAVKLARTKFDNEVWTPDNMAEVLMISAHD